MKSALRRMFDPFRKAVHDGPSKEELGQDIREVKGPQTVPTVWEDGHSKRLFRGKPTPVIHEPTAEQVQQLGDAARTHSICGFCKHFDLENGRKEIARQRFAERLIHDEQWKLQHLGAPIEAIGLCGEYDGELATSFVAKACDHFTPRS